MDIHNIKINSIDEKKAIEILENKPDFENYNGWSNWDTWNTYLWSNDNYPRYEKLTMYKSTNNKKQFIKTIISVIRYDSKDNININQVNYHELWDSF